MSATPEAILDFWFGDGLETLEAVLARSRRWYGGGPAFDEEIRKRFGELPERALHGELDAWREEARPCLALVLVLDQFPRNLHRSSPRAFAGDARAREVVAAAVERGLDRQLSPVEAAFFYLPFEHAEDLEDQERGVELFRALLARAPAPLRPYLESSLDYAVRHRAIIGRFGRFPHRNAVLGRSPTDEERAYLDAGGETFGGGGEAARFEGGCLCGATRFRVAGPATNRCYCHCRSCRLAAGAPFVAWATFPTASFELLEGALAQHRSSEKVVRGFCGACGTALSYVHENRPGEVDVALAALDDASTLRPECHIWLSHKLAWVELGDGLPQHPKGMKATP